PGLYRGLDGPVQRAAEAHVVRRLDRRGRRRPAGGVLAPTVPATALVHHLGAEALGALDADRAVGLRVDPDPAHVPVPGPLLARDADGDDPAVDLRQVRPVDPDLVLLHRELLVQMQPARTTRGAKAPGGGGAVSRAGGANAPLPPAHQVQGQGDLADVPAGPAVARQRLLEPGRRG